MQDLTYRTLAERNYAGYLLRDAPERVLQFGEGNFLRGFVDCFIDLINEKAGFNGKVVLVQPIAQGLGEIINRQEGLYTLYLRGYENGGAVDRKRVISCVSRCINPYADFGALLACARNPDLRYIVSNTTEAGIVYDPASRLEDAPPASFPAKLTRFLFERFQVFGAEPGRGFVILPCELIDNNGDELRRCVAQTAEQWGLGADFAAWLERENVFCPTLVDRIITGYPRAEAETLNAQNGYVDNLIDTGESFGLWVIEGPDSLREELPFEKAGLPVRICDDHKPYKQRKVRILNGAHTAMVPAAYLSGRNIVRDCMEDPVIAGFLNSAIHEEIIPTLTLPRAELETFAASVTERFQNPFIDHSLLSIALNSTSKWRARVLPSVKGYLERFGRVPARLAFSLAATLELYRCKRLEAGKLIAVRGDAEYAVQDDPFVVEFFAAHAGDAADVLVRSACANTRMWGEDLNRLPGFGEAVTGYLLAIRRNGAYETMKELG